MDGRTALGQQQKALAHVDILPNGARNAFQAIIGVKGLEYVWLQRSNVSRAFSNMPIFVIKSVTNME